MSDDVAAAVFTLVRAIRGCVPLPDEPNYVPPFWPSPYSTLETYARLLADEATLDQEIQTRDGFAELTKAIRHAHRLITADPSIRGGPLGHLFDELLETRLYVWSPNRIPSSLADSALIALFQIEETLLDDLRKAAETLLAAAADSADNKTDKSKKKRNTIPTNLDVAKLAKRVKKGMAEGRTKIDIAREFTESDEKKAMSLLRELRRYPRLLE
jgi:hypothetical protein